MKTMLTLITIALLILLWKQDQKHERDIVAHTEVVDHLNDLIDDVNTEADELSRELIKQITANKDEARRVDKLTAENARLKQSLSEADPKTPSDAGTDSLDPDAIARDILTQHEREYARINELARHIGELDHKIARIEYQTESDDIAWSHETGDDVTPDAEKDAIRMKRHEILQQLHDLRRDAIAEMRERSAHHPILFDEPVNDAEYNHAE